jgi:hypothetical protein
MQKMPLSAAKHDRLDLLGCTLIADRMSRLVDRNPSMGRR